MAPSTPSGRIGPSFSISLLLITIICFCGLSSATTPRGITRRRLPQCVVDCKPATDAMDSFCQKSDELRLEQLRDCAIKTCGGNEEEVKQVVALKVGLCNIAQGINTVSSVDIATITDLVADTETISRPTPTTTMNSTTPASITPTASVNISNDNNSAGTTKAKKKKEQWFINSNCCGHCSRRNCLVGNVCWFVVSNIVPEETEKKTKRANECWGQRF